jgi:aldehyde:ferredoxin oxidoreductase
MQRGAWNRYLDVDLGSGELRKQTFTRDELELYLGGRGLGIRMLYDHTDPGLDPYDPRMALVFSTGPLTGSTAPQSNRFCVTTKSPLTGGLADSHCGGNFATRLKRAGYDALLIRGQSPHPVLLTIEDDRVELKDARHLWGQGAMQTQSALPNRFGKAVIGPAGENRVRFACIVSESRVAGRGGTGAVMGSKNLKAILVDGSHKLEPARPEAFKELQRSITKYLLAHPMTGRVLPELGTANLVMTTAGRNIIPTRNFQAGHDLRSPLLSGEKMRDELLAKREGCLHCPIRCGRLVRLAERVTKGPEFETIGLLGNNLGIFDLPAVVELGELCDELGLDTISMGNTLGFATELTERGLLVSELRWGNAGAYRTAIEQTAHRQGLGAELAEGVRRLSERHGGQEFAIQVKGMELPAYDPRGCFGQGLEYATSNRGGCHIRGSTMFLEATGPVSVDPHSPLAKPELVILQQNLNAAVSSLVMCWFSAYAMLPPALFRLDPNSRTYRLLMRAMLRSGPVLRVVLGLKAPAKLLWFEKFVTTFTGRDFSMGDLTELGERVFNLERLYNLREGMAPGEDRLPGRLLDEPTSRHSPTGVPLGEMLPAYYRIRGWDGQGAPAAHTLGRLAIRT